MRLRGHSGRRGLLSKHRLIALDLLVSLILVHKSSMKFLNQWSEEETAFKGAVAEWAQSVVLPRVHGMEKNQQMDSSVVDGLFEMGLMGIEVPERWGGSGSSFTMSCLAVEELAFVDGSVSVLCDVQNTLVANALLKWGNDKQKDKYLPRLSRDTVGAYALSESGSGSDAFALKLGAEKNKDSFILNGHKLWITNGKEAGIFIVFANVDPSLGYKGITAFLVEKDMKGFQVGKKEEKLGIRASSTCELLFENCEVPKENVLGEENKGYKIAIETLNEGRIGIGAQMVGLAQGAYTATLNYIKEREQFGKTLSQFQAVQFQISEMRTELEAARLMVYNAARFKDRGQTFVKEAAMAKLFASRAAEKITSLSIDLFGGNGFSTEYPVEKFWRDAKIGQIYEGTSNMQLQTIAKIELSE